MLVLNLANQSKGVIGYEARQYPDGQQDIRLAGPASFYMGNSVVIVSRMNGWKDLELIVAANQALKRYGVEKVHLRTPYILGARSDRKFQQGGTSYLVDVVAPLINSQNFVSVNALDPHSDVAAACIKNFNSQDNTQLVNWALGKMKPSSIGFGSALKDLVLVSPDAGALKKVYSVAQMLSEYEVQVPVVVANKYRDVATGQILSTKIPDIDLHIRDQKSFVIVDDICDGGRTFIELAKAINLRMEELRNMELIANNTKIKIYLIVTHGIFSGGMNQLEQWFDGIFTTNSVTDEMLLSGANLHFMDIL